MKIDTLGSKIRANIRNRIGWRCYVLALIMVSTMVGSAHSQNCVPDPANCVPDPACEAKFQFNGYDKGAKTVINTCQTNESSSPCAWADATQKSENFLACPLDETGPIALCFYSGVPGPPYFTPKCTLSQAKNAAECDCYKITSAETTYSYVLITAILNKQVYDATVAACCPDGSGCRNFTNPSDPNKSEAPVCQALRDKTLFPGADLISDFADKVAVLSDLEDPPTSFECPTTGGSNLYAGCMTAPCKNTGKTDPTTGLPIVKCTCPTYNGPNQVGNPQIAAGNYSCSPTPYVWSSSFMSPPAGGN
jgi:hypothetical protein